ncbi:MAG: phage-related protein [Mucilaginibacter sp.]|nr:phage-related protein [Mucilaginibacter sp.]
MTKHISATKFDQGKPEHHLLPSLALEEITKAMTFGAKKYEPYNWTSGDGIKWSRYFNACLRHLWKFWRGIPKDEESGLSHLAHAGACIFILFELYLIKKGQDDRPLYYNATSDKSNQR